MIYKRSIVRYGIADSLKLLRSRNGSFPHELLIPGVELDSGNTLQHFPYDRYPFIPFERDSTAHAEHVATAVAHERRECDEDGKRRHRGPSHNMTGICEWQAD